MSFEQVELERGEFWMIGSSKTCRDLQTAAIWATPSCRRLVRILALCGLCLVTVLVGRRSTSRTISAPIGGAQ